MGEARPRPSITIAIPFYRDAALLERAIASVVAQSSPDWRLIVSDDCGPETGIDQLVLAGGDPRVSYARNPKNLGMAGNWNRCLDLAETELVTIFHADDELLPNYVELMTSAAARHPEAAALFCGARIIDGQSRQTFSFPDFIKGFINPSKAPEQVLQGEPALAALLRGNFIMCPTLCYRKSRIGERRFRTDRKQVLDMEFTTGLLLDGEVLTGLREVGYAYRRHGGNATVHQTASLLRFEEEVDLYDDLARTAAGRGWQHAVTVARRKAIIRLNLLFCIVQDMLRLRLAHARRKAAFLTSM